MAKVKAKPKKQEIIDAEVIEDDNLPEIMFVEPKTGIINHYDPDSDEILIEQPKKIGKKLTVKEKQRQAAVLRLSGARYDQIAEILGYANPSGAQKAAAAALENFTLDTAKELYKVHYGRLEFMLQVVWPRVVEGDLSAIAAAAQLMDRIERVAGITSESAHEAEVEDGILVVDGSKDEYLKALKQIRK